MAGRHHRRSHWRSRSHGSNRLSRSRARVGRLSPTVNVLDENILESQRQLLRSWKIPVRQIGVELGRKGMADEEIRPFLITLSSPTFFTRDLGFADPVFSHQRHCLVILEVGQYEVAHYVRRFL